MQTIFPVKHASVEFEHVLHTPLVIEIHGKHAYEFQYVPLEQNCPVSEDVRLVVVNNADAPFEIKERL